MQHIVLSLNLLTLKRFRKKRFAELTRPVERPMGSETLSSGERFALVHSSIPFALVQINKTASVGCFYKAEEN
ncbi:hypothetical protein [Leptospira noguchii]|uniref:hypothetical protein n=1 Tax=Leptospira noguchii TaxID=28182 RepID=UPI000559CAE3|nr:hypothetical protein [Leptospira noguchii]